MPSFSTRRRLARTGDRLRAARTELAVLDEQLAALVLDEAEGHERQVARLEAERARLGATIADLERTQDELLDRL